MPIKLRIQEFFNNPPCATRVYTIFVVMKIIGIFVLFIFSAFSNAQSEITWNGTFDMEKNTALITANLGEGWVAEEALAIAVYCALKAKNLELGVLMAVNITGDSDSTGSMVGQLLGALHGYEAIPDYFLDGLELKPLLEQLSQDLLLIYYYYFGSHCHNKFSLILWELKKRYKLSQVKQ